MASLLQSNIFEVTFTQNDSAFWSRCKHLLMRFRCDSSQSFAFWRTFDPEGQGNRKFGWQNSTNLNEIY